MRYYSSGSLLSYVEQNISRLTWDMKFVLVDFIAYELSELHENGLVHGNIHGGNVLIGGASTDIPILCDIRRLEKSTLISTIQGVLPFIAPEIFHTRKYTKESDIYAFGIIMHLIATGEQPFKDRELDANLISEILHGLRPSMPDSAPDEYKQIAKMCCDADLSKRPDIVKVSKLLASASFDRHMEFTLL